METLKSLADGWELLKSFLDRGAEGHAELATGVKLVVDVAHRKHPDRVYEMVGRMAAKTPKERRDECLQVWSRVEWPEGFEPDWERMERVVHEARPNQYNFHEVAISPEEQRLLKEGGVPESLKWRVRFLLSRSDGDMRFSVEELLEIAEGRVPGRLTR